MAKRVWQDEKSTVMMSSLASIAKLVESVPSDVESDLGMVKVTRNAAKGGFESPIRAADALLARATNRSLLDMPMRG